jgi:hypothetical protein
MQVLKMYMQGFFQEMRQGGAKYSHEEYVGGKSKAL